MYEYMPMSMNGCLANAKKMGLLLEQLDAI